MAGSHVGRHGMSQREMFHSAESATGTMALPFVHHGKAQVQYGMVLMQNSRERRQEEGGAVVKVTN